MTQRQIHAYDGSTYMGLFVATDEQLAAMSYTEGAAPAPTAAQVVAERDRRIEAGSTLSVTGYGDVQLAGDADTRADLQAQAMAAQLHIAAGNPTQSMQVRGTDGTVHTLNTTQMLELWSLGAAYIQGIFAASWTLEAMDPIPADYAADSRWP